jgi:hypothetical protein
MRLSGFVILGSLATLYFLLALEVDGLLAAFGYVASALLYVLAVLNVVRPKK